jgi:molecular chaperone GrpE (heat shock protein)
VREENPILPTSSEVQTTQESIDLALVLEGTGAEISSTAPDDAALRNDSACVISEIREQTILIKSNHGLLVDLASRLKTMSEESISRAQRPLFIDLIMLHDTMKQAVEWIGSSSDRSMEDILLRLGILESELLEILRRRDIRPFDESPTMLDRQMHRTVKTVLTSESEDNNHVLQVVRTGFFIGNKVLRPEEVVISRYDPTLQSERG